MAAGAYGHLSSGAANTGVPSFNPSRSTALIMQWCLPCFLQHAGRFASFFDVSAKSAVAKGRPKMASNAIAINLRNVSIEAPLASLHKARSFLLDQRMPSLFQIADRKLCNVVLLFLRISHE
jgi:hypothetical protein